MGQRAVRSAGQRVGEGLRRVAEALERELKDPRVGFVTRLTDGPLVEPSSRRPAPAEATFYAPARRRGAGRRHRRGPGQRAGRLLRRELGGRLRMRNVPDLRFTHDPVPAVGRRARRAPAQRPRGPATATTPAGCTRPCPAWTASWSSSWTASSRAQRGVARSTSSVGAGARAGAPRGRRRRAGGAGRRRPRVRGGTAPGPWTRSWTASAAAAPTLGPRRRHKRRHAGGPGAACCRRARAAPRPKVGHAGTLDPDAGVLVPSAWCRGCGRGQDLRSAHAAGGDDQHAGRRR